MILDIYQKALHQLMKKPFRLWGISLLCSLLSVLASIGFAAVSAVGTAIGLALTAGMSVLYLNYYTRDVQPQTTDLFAAFRKDRIWHVIGGSAWAILWVVLWSLIPVVGIVFGIIRIYEYRFVPYILMTRDDVKATDAIKVSKEETRGYKGKMFGSDILVIALYLAILLLLFAFSRIPYVGSLFAVLMLALVLVFVVFNKIFYGLVHAGFYAEIRAACAFTPAAAFKQEFQSTPEAEEPAAEEVIAEEITEVIAEEITAEETSEEESSEEPEV